MLAYTRRNTVRAFLFTRTLKGIQALRDEFTADADQYQPEYKPSTQTQISQNKTEIAQTNQNVTNVDNRVTTTNNNLATTNNNLATTNRNVTDVSNRVGTIEANYISAKTVEANYATIASLNATNIAVSGKLSAYDASITYATIGDLSATNGRVGTLESDSLKTRDFSTYYANAAKVYSGRMTASVMEADSIYGKQAAFICGQWVAWKSAHVRMANGSTGWINYLGHV